MRWSLVCGVWGTGGTEWHLSVTLPSNFRRFADSNSDSDSGSGSGPHRRFCLLQHCCTDDCPDDFFSREFGIWGPLLYWVGGRWGLDPHGQKWSLKQDRPWPLLHLGRAKCSRVALTATKLHRTHLKRINVHNFNSACNSIFRFWICWDKLGDTYINETPISRLIQISTRIIVHPFLLTRSCLLCNVLTFQFSAKKWQILEF